MITLIIIVYVLVGGYTFYRWRKMFKLGEAWYLLKFKTSDIYVGIFFAIFWPFSLWQIILTEREFKRGRNK